MMIAVTALISRSIGEGQRNLARSQAGAGIVIAAVVQGSVALLILFFRLELVQLAGAEGKNALDAARYLGLTIMSLVPMAIGLTCSGALRAESLGTKAMYVTLISGLLLMIVDPILIIGLGWGLDGAGIGLVLFRFALAGLGLFFAAYQHQLISMPTRRALGDALGPYVAVAGPAIVTQMAIPAGNYFLTRVMAPFGDDAVAAWAVVARLAVLSLSVHCSCLMRPLTIWANLGAVRLLIGSKMAS
ncbi:MAG: Na+-driven multidrug efflux pump [Ascidiaceihabitans sp.]